jgi:hypothetical protein
LTFVLAFFLAFDLAPVMAERNVEKRAEKAAKAAGDALDAARSAWREGRTAGQEAALKEVRDAVDLSLQSLKDSGKNAHRSPKYFKRVEIELRKLIRRLDNFRIEMSVDERPPVAELQAYTQKAHDKLLLDIMTKEK